MSHDSVPSPNGGVVVGVDGSVGAGHALEWAMANAGTLGPVHPVMVYQVDALGDGLGLPGAYMELSQIFARDADQRFLEVLEPYPGLAEAGTVVRGSTGPTLVESARQADLLVVGCRGRSAFAEMILGSVGSYCVDHATVPVVVVTDPPDGPTLDHVVVGIDGSANALAALKWALDHVNPAGCIEAVICWEPEPGGQPRLAATRRARAEARIQQVLDHVADSHGASIDGQPATTSGDVAPIKKVVEYGDPRSVLRKFAKSADALVIGARGRRGFERLMTGSVASALLHHPVNTMIVVPPVSRT